MYFVGVSFSIKINQINLSYRFVLNCFFDLIRGSVRMVTNIIGFDSLTDCNERRCSEIKNQRKMEIKMLVNKKTDMIIGRLLNENPYFPGGPMYRILIKGDQKFIKSDHVEVRKFKSRTK